MKNDDVSSLIDWFKEEQRDFPWREIRTPYVVLVSEIMLQQTKAAAVLPYFVTWMKRFPNFKTLAAASEEEAIKAWEGLGYYSRARNLRNIAIAVEREYGGVFPSDLLEILSFKGIGSYTAAAISHFAFDERAVGADGNIKKVIARYYGYQDRVDRGSEILNLVDEFLPITDSSACFEALIELGATICAKKPKCVACPLAGGCIAYIDGKTDVIPVVKKREKIIPIYRAVYYIEHQGSVLVQRQVQKLMNGLYELPFLEIEGKGCKVALLSQVEEKLGLKLLLQEELKQEVHFFTKYKSHLRPFRCLIKKIENIPEGFEFLAKADLSKYPFSSGHRRVVNSLAR